MASLFKNLFACLSIAFFVTNVVGQEQATASPTAPRPEIVVLHNGQLIEGVVVEDGDRIKVDPGTGRWISLLNERVWFRCGSLIDAYWGMAARTKVSDLNGQIKILQFCIRNQLISQAENQIDILQMMPIKASRLDYLNRQLKVARFNRQQAKLKKQRAAALASQPPKTIPDAIEFRPLPAIGIVEPSGVRSTAPSLHARRQSPDVAQVGFEQPVKPTESKPAKTKTKTKTKSKVPSARELERLSDSLPKHSVAFFKRRIEPLMARSCFATNCHGPDTQWMPLTRLEQSRVMPRKLSQRNLYSIMRYADRYAPLDSTLLKMASTPHGGAKQAALRKNSVQFNNTAQWLISVSNQPNQLHKIPDWFGLPKFEPPVAPMTAEIDAQLPAAAEEPEVDLSEFDKLPAALRLTGALPFPGKAKKPVDQETPEKKPTEPAARDPFDAEVFNRKYGKKPDGK